MGVVVLSLVLLLLPGRVLLWMVGVSTVWSPPRFVGVLLGAGVVCCDVDFCGCGWSVCRSAGFFVV